MQRLPVIYVRGYAGATAGINEQVDDPFYGFNEGATHIRVGGGGDPLYHQFEGPMVRLMTDHNYRLLVRGDQQQYLHDAQDGTVPRQSVWVYRFYDQAATTFVDPPPEGLLKRLWTGLHQRVTADGFDIEKAGKGLYDLIMLVRAKTGAKRVFLVAHSMGGLVCRCMIQKICAQPGREPAKDIVGKLFTYGTPHGGIAFNINALDWAQQAFGPAGADIFSPAKMYGYLTPGKTFGDRPRRKDDWDPQAMDDKTFPLSSVFCLIGTNPRDYGPARLVVGPKSDGLVRIEHAYVRGAHRAYVHRSHSGSYGEVNSEEGYQSLRRFLFGRWGVTILLDGLPALPSGGTSLSEDDAGSVWQADMRLSIRGLPIVMSEQLAAHWCPIQINEELTQHNGSAETSVPLASTFLLDPAHEAELAKERGDGESVERGRHRLRYSLTLRVYKLIEQGEGFRFEDHLEQVPDWADTLIVDVGPDDDGEGLTAWAAWNSEVTGANDQFDPITDALPIERREALALTRDDEDFITRVTLPPEARALPILAARASLTVRVTDRLER